MVADGRLNPADYDEYIEGIVNAALAAAARAGPTPDAAGDSPTTEPIEPPEVTAPPPA
jgi:hypothetical protein